MPFNTAFSKSRVHGYPKLWFHLFRFVQFLASAIVAGIMVFFIIHLRGHRITIPWFFFFLQSAAATTLIWLAISTFLYCGHRLSPSTSAIANGLTGAIWIAAFGLLAWRMNNLTFRSCTTELWGDEKGVLVCKVYKFLFGAAIIAIVGNICAFILDLRTLRRGDGMGKYTRTTAERTGVEPMRHKNLSQGIVVEETLYLRPGPNEQLYDSGSRSHSPDAFNVGRQ